MGDGPGLRAAQAKRAGPRGTGACAQKVQRENYTVVLRRARVHASRVASRASDHV